MINKFIDIWKDRKCEQMILQNLKYHIEYDKRVQFAMDKDGKDKQFASDLIKYDGPGAHQANCPALLVDWRQSMWVRTIINNNGKKQEKIIEPFDKSNPDKFIDEEDVSSQIRPQFEAFKVTDCTMNWGVFKSYLYLITILFVVYLYIFIQVQIYVVYIFHQNLKRNHLNYKLKERERIILLQVYLLMMNLVMLMMMKQY